jgi:hypothetical protein
MGENSCRARKYLSIVVGTIDRGQHKHGKLYRRAPNIDSRIERRIGNISPNAW